MFHLNIVENKKIEILFNLVSSTPPFGTKTIKNRVNTITMALTIGDTADNPETSITRKEAWDRFILIVKPEQSGKTP